MKTHPNIEGQLKAVPSKPGCYIYRDERRSVLYVGKAINLRNRVRSYFRESANHGIRIARMVHRVRDIEWMVVENELEALVLECNLIKEHRPPFNVRLRDDKSYPYVAITNEKFPRVLFTRNPRRDGSRYFGPYTSAYAVRETIQLLHKVFPLIPCGKSWRGDEDQRPCLYYHLKQCLGPCAGLADSDEYRGVVERVRNVLGGKADEVVGDLKEKMGAHAERLEFEDAALLRDKIHALQSMLERQQVLSTDEEDRDVISVVKDDRGAAIQMLYVRNGKLIGQQQFLLDGSGESSPTEAVQEFVKQYYSSAPEIPREVLLPVEIEERKIVQQWLRSRRGAAVSVEVPQAGQKMRLIELAAMNAEQALATMRDEAERKEAWAEAAMSQLAEELQLANLPMRIEGYDISNIQGTAPVGSMVVLENGEAAKAEYRRFKIRYHPEDPNDFAMMHELITRRLRNYLDDSEKFGKLPDLMMIDGGKGQLAAALKARDSLGLTVPMIGLAKRMELIIIPDGGPPRDESGLEERADGHNAFERYSYVQGKASGYEFRELELPTGAPGLLLLTRLRDEAHRFAITFHRKVRDKRMTGSALDEIPGIGPRRRRMLLRNFGSIAAIRKATVEQLAAVPTMTETLAHQVREYLNAE